MSQILSPQNLIAIGQLVVAILMLWSLKQTARNLDYARMQIEAGKLPSIEIASFSDTLRLLNSGGSGTEQFQIVGCLAAHYRWKSEEVTRLMLSAPPLSVDPICKRLAPGEEVAIPFEKLTLASSGSPPEPDEQEVFAVVLRYYRSADRRRFFKIVPFLRSQTEKGSEKNYLYFPLYVVPGTGLGGPNGGVFKKLRDTVREICVQNFDIESLGNIQ